MKKLALIALPLMFTMAACNETPAEDKGEQMDEAMGTEPLIGDGPMEEAGEDADDAMEARGDAIDEAADNMADGPKQDAMEDKADGM